jgi:hypothetical protein
MPTKKPVPSKGKLFKHGTDGAYAYHKCRCAECKRAHADAQIEYYHYRKQMAIATQKLAAMKANPSTGRTKTRS